VTDDSPANRLTVTEHYAIKSFWQRSEKNKRLEASIEAPDVSELLRQPRSQVRDSPLSLPHPVELTSITEMLLPPGRWKGNDDDLRIDDPAFRFERSERWKGATVLLTDRFVSRVDHIEPAHVARYAANLEKARQGLNYTLFTGSTAAAPAPPSGAVSPHWVAAVAGTLALIGFGALALRVYRWDPPPPSAEAPRYPLPPSGLGGWLIFAALNIAASLLRVAHALWENWASYGTDTRLALTTAGASAYHPLWSAVLLFELVFNLGLLIGYALLAWLFFTKRSSLPRVFIVVTAVMIGASLIDMALTASIPAAAKNLTSKEWGEFGRSVVVAVIWIAYFRRSGRARITFVRRLAAVPASATSSPANPITV
jgi:Protein of unknown function (DUF2569)